MTAVPLYTLQWSVEVNLRSRADLKWLLAASGSGVAARRERGLFHRSNVYSKNLIEWSSRIGFTSVVYVFFSYSWLRAKYINTHAQCHVVCGLVL